MESARLQSKLGCNRPSVPVDCREGGAAFTSPVWRGAEPGTTELAGRRAAAGLALCANSSLAVTADVGKGAVGACARVWRTDARPWAASLVLSWDSPNLAL